MAFITRLHDHTGSRPEKFFKTTLFQSNALMLGVNCLEAGQAQDPHDHSDQDKFYYVVDGRGRFQLGDQWFDGQPGDVIWAPAGVVHGVVNDGDTRLTLLVGIAPAP